MIFYIYLNNIIHQTPIKINTFYIKLIDIVYKIVYNVYIVINMVIILKRKESRMAQINIKIDDELKTKAEILFNELGLNMSTAITIFIRQSIREGRIPFDVKLVQDIQTKERNNIKLLDTDKV